MSVYQERLLFGNETTQKLEGLKSGLGLQIEVTGTEFGQNVFFVNIPNMREYMEAVTEYARYFHHNPMTLEIMACKAITEALASEMKSFKAVAVSDPNPLEKASLWYEVPQKMKYINEVLKLESPVVVLFDLGQKFDRGGNVIHMWAAGRTS